MKTSIQSDELEANGIPITQLHVKICMHVLGTASTDVRVMREATALVEAGFSVSIVDIEEKSKNLSRRKF